MQNEAILNKILESTYALTDVYKRVRVLKKYLVSKLFESNSPPEEDLNLELPWLSSLGQDFYNQFNVQNVYQIFEELEKKLETLNPLVIYLSYEPAKQDIENIGKWLRSNTKTIQIFDIKYDRDLIGGCTLVVNGKYRDYSLRSQIQENSKEVSGIIRSNLIAK